MKQEIQVGHLIVPYRVIRQGKPMILIHGLAGSSRWWSRNIHTLAEHYRLYLLDLPGFGSMHRLPRQYTLDEIASGIVSWMDVVGIPQAYLLDHSMDGYLSLWIAAHSPAHIHPCPGLTSRYPS